MPEESKEEWIAGLRRVLDQGLLEITWGSGPVETAEEREARLYKPLTKVNGRPLDEVERGPKKPEEIVTFEIETHGTDEEDWEIVELGDAAGAYRVW